MWWKMREKTNGVRQDAVRVLLSSACVGLGGIAYWEAECTNARQPLIRSKAPIYAFRRRFNLGDMHTVHIYSNFVFFVFYKLHVSKSSGKGRIQAVLEMDK
jgi:hypothetical protein